MTRGTGRRPARVEDVHDLALGMPHVTVHPGTQDRPVYQVGGRSFVFWVPSEGDKLALVQDAWLSRASSRRAAAWLSASSDH